MKIAMQIQAPPVVAYRKFVRDVGEWWNSSHTFSVRAKNLPRISSRG
ncbi:MAG TPA: hypothetical protein VKE70_12680 [Candidatus Solibacter sp.]|nr:hypothetical protein [Candidatus Solibacter sp.]